MGAGLTAVFLKPEQKRVLLKVASGDVLTGRKVSGLDRAPLSLIERRRKGHPQGVGWQLTDAGRDVARKLGAKC